jgi:transposase
VLRPHVADGAAGVHAGDSLGIADRVHVMVDISDDTKVVRRRVEVTGVVRRRRWSDEEKGRIVAEAIAPDAVIADVARRHDLVPQHLWNRIKAAREGRFALPGDGLPAFVRVVSVQSGQASEPAPDIRSSAIELVIGAVTVRVPAGAGPQDIEAVLRAVWRCNA